MLSDSCHSEPEGSFELLPSFASFPKMYFNIGKPGAGETALDELAEDRSWAPSTQVRLLTIACPEGRNLMNPPASADTCTPMLIPDTSLHIYI